MTEKTKAGDIGRGANKFLFCELGADRVNLGHQGDHFFLEWARGDPPFYCGGGDSGAERFGENK